MTYHFIGIGGVSMSAIAHVLLNRGETVTGSDRQNSPEVERLRALGAEIAVGHSADNIKNPDLVVFTAAIGKDNPELLAARKRGIPTIERAPFLGELMQDYGAAIAVSGTHGKTTTTGMIACIFRESGVNPTLMIGGNLPQIDGNVHIGSEEILVMEACEYVDSFLNFNPKIAVITNIEADHLDYFSGGISQIRDSFTKFVNKLPEDGFVVVNMDDKNAVISAEKSDGRKVFVSLCNPAADYCTENIAYHLGKASFLITKNNENLAEISLNVRGEHNVYNALCAFAVAHEYGLQPDVIKRGLEDFSGTARRFELRGEFNGIKVFDDYAHHPTEIKTTFATAETIPHNKIWYVFQPHTYSRTKALYEEFINVLSQPENIIIADIYAARENPIKNITSESLAKDSGATYLGEGLVGIAEHLKKAAQKGDIIVTIGAGDVNKICSELLL